MTNTQYASPLKKLDPTREDGETIVYFSWDPVACRWIVIIPGECVSSEYAARLIVAAGSALVPPAPVIEDDPVEDDLESDTPSP